MGYCPHRHRLLPAPAFQQSNTGDEKRVRGFRVVTAVGEMRVGRIVEDRGDYYVVRRSFSRKRYPLPKREAVVDSERGRVLMNVPRKVLFDAPEVHRNGELGLGTDLYYGDSG
jgi:hypothetical protein